MIFHWKEEFTIALGIHTVNPISGILTLACMLYNTIIRGLSAGCLNIMLPYADLNDVPFLTRTIPYVICICFH